MARHKKSKARLKGQRAGPRKNAGEYGKMSHQIITMQQEALYTEHCSLFRSNSPLRQRGIHFVKAGVLQQEEGLYSDSSSPEGDTEEAPKRLPEESQDTPSAHERVTEELFSIDKTRDDSIQTGFPDPVIASPSSRAESSSEDEVLFRGRSKQIHRTHCIRHGLTESTFAGHQNYEPTLAMENEGDVAQDGNLINVAKANCDSSESTMPLNCALGGNLLFGDSHKTKPCGRRRNQRRHADSSDGTEDVIADYIANIDKEYEDLSISSLNLLARCSHREERSRIENGNQVLRTKRIKTDAEATEDSDDSESGSDVNSAFDESDGDLEYALKFDETTDSGSINGDQNADIGALSIHGQAYAEYASNGRRTSPTGSASPVTSVFADEWNDDVISGFDVLNFGHPTSSKKAKDKHRDFHLDLTDSELEDSLVRAWRNDREKKKMRKQHRAELRSQGLLGRSRSNPGRKGMYWQGLDHDNLKDEFRAFLLSSKESLSLPPMSKQNRKLVHDMANALSLKSQSRGNGSTRFPILYRTSRTPRYSSRTVFQAEKILSAGKFSRRMKEPSGVRMNKATNKRESRPDASVSYMDGDIVGAAAPELGAENKGRVMLEKMGWSSGTALGATNNKGILIPVSHVVKSTRAGLG